jgi:hypothetical protein
MTTNLTTTTASEAIERQTEKFDYTVSQVPFHLPNGSQTRFLANVRDDNGEVLGCVSDRYEVLQNSDMLGASEDLFKAEGFSNFKRKTVCTNGGARIRAIYDFPDHGFKLSNGNDLTFRLKVQNSFDGSLRASFQVGLVRLVCTNGLALPVAAVGMSRKHTQHLDPNGLREAFARSINAFKESAPLFNRMIETRLTQEEGNSILLNFEKSKVMSERMREGIQAVWERPTYAEDSTRNLFNLYNATTQHLTHSVEGKRFELAERVNTGVLNSISKAVKRNNLASLMVANLGDN